MVGNHHQGQQQQKGHRWGPLKSLLALSPVLVGAPLLAYWHHAHLPIPKTELTDPLTRLPQISESNILNVSRYLSEDIGYRTVGTYEHALGDAWLYDRMLEMKGECERIVERMGGRRKLECEVWRQQGSGSHRFDMMGKRLYKTYVNLTNIIVRVSNGTPSGKEHAILVNSHLDSTLPSPGAADDALCVGVMMDVMRVLLNTPDWEPEYAIVFLFNNAEESLQDGSHLFSTQHPIASTVRAAINLEAAGTTGRELLFQATSEQMIEAYSHVPRPFGTILANDIFSSGIILSDTDFRQFEQYLNVTGLDMAVVGNSYLYHMRKDLVENIQPGVAQHMAENTLALLQYLSSRDSPLPTLTEGYIPPSTVFFSHIGVFIMYSFSTAKVMYSALLLASVMLVRARGQVEEESQKEKASGKGDGGGHVNGEVNEVNGALKANGSNGIASAKELNGVAKASVAESSAGAGGMWKEQSKAVGAVLCGGLGGIIISNLVALVMSKVLGKGMSWFSNEYSVMVLYGVPMLLGILLSQYLIGPIPEGTMFGAILLVKSAAAFVLQSLGIGSAVLFFISALPLFVSLLLNPLFTRSKTMGEISLVTYGIGLILPLITGTMLLVSVVEFFVPLTGRIGAGAPADTIIATVVSTLGFQTVSFVLPLAHRFGRRSLLRGIVFLTVLMTMVMAVFAVRKPFDEMHQKRLFVLHLENVTSHERHLHLSAADGAPGLDQLVGDIAKEFAQLDAVPSLVVMDDHNSDWDSLYPFSAFLTAYKISLPVEYGYVSPWASGNNFSVTAVNDVKDFASGTRSLTLEVHHPGLIWTVIAFDAHVLQWTLDDNPPDEFARHHIKEASFYGTDTWTVDLVTKLDPSSSSGGLTINFIGLEERGIWPAKQARVSAEERGAAMRMFEKFDGWLEDKTAGTVDALLMGCVAGVVVV
ncbi:hypothetical protein AX17_007200 [Amanita inopinata Kibby_2008]|nr:hypothetical protein AX17_007200 [Amanita inopinata Kibby_2008]